MSEGLVSLHCIVSGLYRYEDTFFIHDFVKVLSSYGLWSCIRFVDVFVRCDKHECSVACAMHANIRHIHPLQSTSLPTLSSLLTPSPPFPPTPSPQSYHLPPRINLQIQLHAIRHSIIRQAQKILKRALTLPLQHNLMRLASYSHGD